MEFLIFPTAKAASEAAAKPFISLLQANPNAVLGLATGNSPKLLYQALADSGVSFADATTFNLDEYACLPENHPCRYDVFMQNNLFGKLGQPPKATHFPSAANLAVYDDMIAQAGGIDLQLLGIGSAGHIAFNEVGSPLDSLTRVVVLSETTRRDNSPDFHDIGQQVPELAYSMGIKSVLAAKKIIMLAFGASKAGVIARLRALEHDKNGQMTTDLPASALWGHGDVTVYLDAASSACSNIEK